MKRIWNQTTYNGRNAIKPKQTKLLKIPISYI